MIDYINFELVSNIDGISKNLIKSRIQEASLTTGEFIGKFSHTFIGDDIKVKFYKSGRVFVSGSLHKLSHSLNWSYFPYGLLEGTIKNVLHKALGDSIWDAEIHNLEFGVNFRPPVDPETVLNGLMLHKTRPFKDLKQFKSGRYKCHIPDLLDKML